MLRLHQSSKVYLRGDLLWPFAVEQAVVLLGDIVVFFESLHRDFRPNVPGYQCLLRVQIVLPDCSKLASSLFTTEKGLSRTSHVEFVQIGEQFAVRQDEFEERRLARARQLIVNSLCSMHKLIPVRRHSIGSEVEISLRSLPGNGLLIVVDVRERRRADQLRMPPS